LIAGGVGATSKPTTISDSKVESVAVGTVETVEASESVVGTSKISGVGTVEKNVLGIKLKPSEFKYTGKFEEVAKPIDLEFVGLQSQEQVYRTSGLGSLKINLPKKQLIVSSESTGFEVAGVGKRLVTQSVNNAPAERFVETFVANPQGDKMVGSVVSKKGAGLFVVKQEAEVGLLKRGGTEYFNPETGLKSATSTLNFNPDEVVTVKYFKEANLGSSKVPLSSEYTYEAAGERLRNNIKPKILEVGVGDVQQRRIDSGTTQSLVSQSKTPLVTNLKAQVESIVQSRQPPVEVKIPISVPVNQQRLSLGEELSFKTNKPLVTEAVVLPTELAFATPTISSNQKNPVDLGVSPFQKIGSLNSTRNKQSSSSISSLGLTTGQVVNSQLATSPIQTPKSFNEQLARQTPLQVSKLNSSQFSKLGLFNRSTPRVPANIPLPYAGLDLEGGGLFGVVHTIALLVKDRPSEYQVSAVHKATDNSRKIPQRKIITFSVNH